MSFSPDDWSKAEALATAYLKTKKKAVEPIEVVRAELTPFLFAARWADGNGYVLVFDGKVQTERGLSILPSYFAFLGEKRLRALPVGKVRGLLEILDADPKGVGPLWEGGGGNKDLAPAIVDRDGVLKYVVHYRDPAPKGPLSGTKPPGSLLYFTRLSLQLFPHVPDLAWKSEERIERPAPGPGLVLP